MNYKIIIIIISILISSAITGEEKSNSKCDSPDTLTPSSATLFLKFPKIAKVIDFLNSKKEYYGLGNSIFKYDKWIKQIKDKTNIDVLNAKSLKEAGINVNNSLYLTSIDNEKKIPEAVLFIPITDKKNFPLGFVKFLNKLSDKKEIPDPNPAISPYKGIKVFQIMNDTFFSVIDNYFILTSSGNILKQIIDLKINGCEASLSMDPLYNDYKNKSKNNSESNIFTVYIKKEFVERSFDAIRERHVRKEAAKLNKIKTEIAESKKNKDDSIIANEPPQEQESPQKTKLDFIKYLSFRFDGTTNEISLTGALSVNKDDQTGDLLTRTITTGLFEKALFAENPTGYLFLSIDIKSIFKHLEDLSKKDADTKKAYSKWMISPEGKNILEDIVLPCDKSFINIFSKKPDKIGEMDNFVVFIPLEGCGKIEATMKKIKKELNNKYTANGEFGEEKINGNNSFWFKNDPKNKIYILEHKGNVYAGNNTDFIKTVLNAKDKKSLDIQKEFIKKIDRDTFLVSFTQFSDDSFLKAILMMLTYNQNPGLYNFINKIDNLNLTGKKVNNDLIFNYSIKILPEKNNK